MGWLGGSSLVFGDWRAAASPFFATSLPICVWGSACFAESLFSCDWEDSAWSYCPISPAAPLFASSWEALLFYWDCSDCSAACTIVGCCAIPTPKKTVDKGNEQAPIVNFLIPNLCWLSKSLLVFYVI